MSEKKDITEVKAIRNKYKVTQQEVSNITGIPKRTVENWDSGDRKPPEWLPKLLDASLAHSFSKQLLQAAYQQENVPAKALANYIFRQVIEDVHAKYNISQEDMKAMCKKAVNRAQLYVTLVTDENPDLINAFGVFAIDALEWDEPEYTEDIEKDVDLITQIAVDL